MPWSGALPASLPSAVHGMWALFPMRGASGGGSEATSWVGTITERAQRVLSLCVPGPGEALALCGATSEWDGVLGPCAAFGERELRSHLAAQFSCLMVLPAARCPGRGGTGLAMQYLCALLLC